MRLSSLFLLAGVLCSAFAVLMASAGSEDPMDARFITGLLWVGAGCFTAYVVVRVIRRVKATRKMNEWRHRLDEADIYRHSGVRR